MQFIYLCHSPATYLSLAPSHIPPASDCAPQAPVPSPDPVPHLLPTSTPLSTPPPPLPPALLFYLLLYLHLLIQYLYLLLLPIHSPYICILLPLFHLLFLLHIVASRMFCSSILLYHKTLIAINI